MSQLRMAGILFLFSTFVLKFSSMLRDLVIAHFFGASYIADAYIAAITIPNAIILFMLTGMKDAFVPSYIKYETKGLGYSHLTNVVKGTFWIALVISIIGMLLSPLLIPWIYGFEGKGNTIAVWTSVIYFASVVFVGVNAVYEGYFDAKQRFSFSTFSQTIVVFCTIAGAILFAEKWGIYALPAGYFVGTLLSFIMKWVYLFPDRFLKWSQKLDKQEVSMFYKIFLPVGLTIAVGQVNLFVNTLFASRLGEGVIAYLNYAFRLVNIPQAIFGVTIATMIFPLLSKARATDNMDLFKSGIEKGLSFMFLFLAPTVAGMVFLMDEIVSIVYQRGEFSASAAEATSDVAIFYIGSVLFYSIQAVIAKGFYTLEKGHYILRVGLISIVLNVVFNWILSNVMGYDGLALSASIVGFVYSVITFTTLYKIVGGFSLKTIGKEYGKILAATIGMIAGLFLLHSFVHPLNLNIYFYTTMMIIAGAILYFIGLYASRSDSMKQILNRKQKLKA